MLCVSNPLVPVSNKSKLRWSLSLTRQGCCQVACCLYLSWYSAFDVGHVPKRLWIHLNPARPCQSFAISNGIEPVPSSSCPLPSASQPLHQKILLYYIGPSSSGVLAPAKCDTQRRLIKSHKWKQFTSRKGVERIRRPCRHHEPST
jgi:hypothetical protein